MSETQSGLFTSSGRGPSIRARLSPSFIFGSITQGVLQTPQFGSHIVELFKLFKSFTTPVYLFTSLFLFIFVLCFWRFTEEEEDHYILLLLFDVTKT